MYLKRLSLRGFKSFATVTTFSLEPGITAIVGPNGSGKSNVVDALAWVMGEQGAKSLRGGSMEDVIFAGTSSRAPLGRAEVQLTIDNADGALPIDYAEVTLTRTKFRNGNSEYAINGSACRLLDVRELLSDSGIGREMHVIVGQGHLDQILSATPEARRGFIEEAAGVLKHRDRKDKALRKLDATAANLNRLSDLTNEIRRQLKPLGRQAEVAQRAGQVQAEVRDAKARLMADDIAQAIVSLNNDDSDLASSGLERQQVEQQLEAFRSQEDRARADLLTIETRHRASAEMWFALSALTERLRLLTQLAQDRYRSASGAMSSQAPSQDIVAMRTQADQLEADEARLRSQVEQRQQSLTTALGVRQSAEEAYRLASQAFDESSRAHGRTRELIARLTGQLSSTQARISAAHQRIDALTQAVVTAEQQANAAVEAQKTAQGDLLPAGDDQALVDKVERAKAAVQQADAQVEQARRRHQELAQQQAALIARTEALSAALQARLGNVSDATDWAEVGSLGSVADLIQVEPGYEAAVAGALGSLAESQVIDDIDQIWSCRIDQRGQAGRIDWMVTSASTAALETAPMDGVRRVTDLISADPGLTATLDRLLADLVVVDDLEQAKTWLKRHPQSQLVTRDGDRLSSLLVRLGQGSTDSAIALAALARQAEEESLLVGQQLALAQQDWRQTEQEQRRLAAEQAEAEQTLESHRRQLSAAQASLSRINQAAGRAQAEAEQRREQLERASRDLANDEESLATVTAQLELAGTDPAASPPDREQVDSCDTQAKAARAAETEARIAWRTLEERVRSIAGQAAALRRAAIEEEEAQSRRAFRLQRLEKQLAQARAAGAVASWLGKVAMAVMDRAGQERDSIGQQRQDLAEQAEQARLAVRDLTVSLERLVDLSHRRALAQAQQQMRVDALVERASQELGLSSDDLLAEFGPDQLVTVIHGDDEAPTFEPYDRDQQLKRLRRAERDLQLLGKVNPLALEEFNALQERHAFLMGQLEDLKKTRADLLGIVDEVDARVRDVFSQAYADVAEQFESTFARLFPGGEGRLVLTQPEDWLTTGVEVEARPAGKKVKRLSLLSGGERSLVAVCFLVALFKARPSPFYILDEVEAALDDTNLGRLLDIYEELRSTSQLLVITHQKRTMEIADTLYGVTMGAQGTSRVVSQRLRED
ncbi:MAG: chromosome segregation protein SMC [Propionibacteriaceae bacterium]|nr:chromosome segregation protein SMC [Propionibacteriaceae bacterium]